MHGDSGLGGATLPPPAASPRAGHAVDYIIDTIGAAPGQITLVATGPLTNIALAVRREPRLAEWVRNFVIMGGSAGRGNTTPAAEYNMWADPEAAAIVFGAGWTVIQLGLDVTLRTGATTGVLDTMRTFGKLGGDLLVPALQQYMSRPVTAESGPPVHDVCAVVWVARPDLFELTPAQIEVETAGRWTSGMTVTSWSQPGSAVNASVATGIDVAGFWTTALDAYAGLAGALAG